MSARCTILRGVVIDAHVTAEFPIRPYEYGRWSKEEQRMLPGTPEDLAKLLEQRCREFVDFLRDHRSQDIVRLDVVRERKDLCSVCKQEWDEAIDDETKERYCACCGAILEPQPAIAVAGKDGE